MLRKLRRATAMASALVALVSGSAAYAQPISKNELVNLGQQALHYKQPDQFSAGFDDTSAAGKEFDFILPISGSQIYHGTVVMPPGGWSYDPDTQKLTVSVEQNSWIPDPNARQKFAIPSPVVQGFEVSNSKKNAGKDVEQNALGAKVVVQHYETTSVGVAMITQEARDGSVHFDAPSDRLSAAVSEEPESARADAKVIVVEVKGRILPLPNGKVSICGIDGAAPAFNMPTGVVEHYCVFNAAITSIAVVANGRSIAFWDQSYKALTVEEYEKRRFENLVQSGRAGARP
jgi:hypothetical protein